VAGPRLVIKARTVFVFSGRAVPVKKRPKRDSHFEYFTLNISLCEYSQVTLEKIGLSKILLARRSGWLHPQLVKSQAYDRR